LDIRIERSILITFENHIVINKDITFSSFELVSIDFDVAQYLVYLAESHWFYLPHLHITVSCDYSVFLEFDWSKRS